MGGRLKSENEDGYRIDDIRTKALRYAPTMFRSRAGGGLFARVILCMLGASILASLGCDPPRYYCWSVSQEAGKVSTNKSSWYLDTVCEARLLIKVCSWTRSSLSLILSTDKPGPVGTVLDLSQIQLRCDSDSLSLGSVDGYTLRGSAAELAYPLDTGALRVTLEFIVESSEIRTKPLWLDLGSCRDSSGHRAKVSEIKLLPPMR